MTIPLMVEIPSKSALCEIHTPRYHPLVIVLAAVSAGIVADRYWPASVLLWWAGAGVAWIAWWALWRRGWDRTAAVVLMLAAAAVAGSWHHLRWNLFLEDDLGSYAGAMDQPVCVEAIALQIPRSLPPPERSPLRPLRTGDRVRLEVAPVAVRDGAQWRDISGRAVLMVFAHLPDVRPGDRLRVFAQLAAPASAQNPGEFDYAEYLRGGRVRSELQAQFAECVSVVAPGSAWSFRGLLERVRSRGNRLLERYMREQPSELAAAVLLGAREQIEPERTEAFMETGIIHLLSISGLHVGILAGAVLFLTRRLPIPQRWAMAMVALWALGYMLLVDAQPPVVRATIMVLVICGSAALGRRALSVNSLAAGALIVQALSPADLFRVGPQLSFLAAAGLMWFAPSWMYSMSGRDPLGRMIAESRGWLARIVWLAGRSLRHFTLVSAMIWLLTMPLVMARFNLLSPVALVLNTLVWVPTTLGLVSGFATLVFGGLAAPLGQVLGGLCDVNLWLLEWLVTAGRDVPFGHLWLPGPADWWLAGFYGGLGLLAAFPRVRPPRRWTVALLAAWAAVGFTAAGLRHQSGRLDCTFLSIGHGCAVVLVLPSGQTMLYDAGQLGSPMKATRCVAGLLWSRGITHLDAVVLSHPDVDHYNAIPGLLERFSVGVIYVSPVMFENQSPALGVLQAAIRRSGVPLREIRAGDELAGGENCRIEVLHPPRRGVLGSENANSVVLAVDYLGRRILLSGDLEPPGLDALLAEAPAHCDVLLVPHHGSAQSNAPGLAAWATPACAIISGTHRWDTAPIEQAYRAAGSRTLHTADTGAISVRIDPGGVAVDAYLARGRGR